MIRFEQVGDGKPKDIQVTTDDANAELVTMQDAFEEAEAEDMQAAINTRDVRANDEGNFVFIIPGDEAGELADIFTEEIPLAEYLDELNAKALEDAEE